MSTSTELRFVGRISDGEYDREIEIEAIPDGLRIDDVLIIPWEWIERARSLLVRCPASVRTFLLMQKTTNHNAHTRVVYTDPWVLQSKLARLFRNRRITAPRSERISPIILLSFV